jgi:TamB, inner membrane protein subunit of TAM complex
VEALRMDVMGTTQKGTKLTLPIKSDFNNSTYDYISFKEYGKLVDDTLNRKKKINENKLMLDILLKATPDAEISIVLDPATGEEIQGVGEGDLVLKIDLDNSFTMNGEYAITKGKYVFGFRNVLKKDLEIEPGGTIRWDRDPLKAKLDLVASYTKSIPILPLLDASILNSQALVEARLPIPTKVNIKLTGEMLKPEIAYDIEQPNNNDINSLAYKELIGLRSNQGELLNQAISIIFLNTFRGKNSVSTISSGTLLNNANELVSSTLSSIISNMLKIKNFDVNIGYQNFADQSSSSDQFSLQTSYKTDRWKVVVGNNVKHLRGSSGSNGTTVASISQTNFDIQYLITPDGRFRISAFKVPTSDVLSGTIDPGSKSGLGLLYRKNFNNFYLSKRKTYEEDVPTIEIPDSNKTKSKGSD